ncbi:MAG: hypothetical protein KAR21_21765, partial [Spirochaetales bacterium]|nr:hypothetical protein [Spirochaetales bacterium]
CHNNPVKYVDPTGNTHGEAYWNAYNDYYSDNDNNDSDHPGTTDNSSNSGGNISNSGNGNYPSVFTDQLGVCSESDNSEKAEVIGRQIAVGTSVIETVIGVIL